MKNRDAVIQLATFFAQLEMWLRLGNWLRHGIYAWITKPEVDYVCYYRYMSIYCQADIVTWHHVQSTIIDSSMDVLMKYQ